MKAILVHYNDHDGISSNGAKTEFLNTLYKWPTFGSAFFEVRVSIQQIFVIFFFILQKLTNKKSII